MKNARHQQILKLIQKYSIGTQEELAACLNESGFTVTQATVSRDIRQLRLHKAPDENGRLRYVFDSGDSPDIAKRYRDVLKASYVSMDVSFNILVMHTVSGMAMAAAAALDSLDWPEILGCIAGDDTIFIVIRSPEDAENLIFRIKEMIDIPQL
ncbi:MAG: arginine repressor [Lachnospiraceae bacterium]|nr:arginine repressor [Lachnospiraceae bacterium]